MNKIYKTFIICAVVGLLSYAGQSFAGNRDRSGQAGAASLLIDPWARTNGWGNAGVAEIRGMESVYSNVAGLAFVKKTELGFSRTQYLTGSNCGININAIAIGQSLSKKDKATGRKIKDFGVIGISVFMMNFGDIPITTVDQPEGNMGNFSPRYFNIGIHYAKSFNQYIHGGVSIKIVNESVSDLSATGVAIDAGVQYLAGPYENFKIGVALKNIGLPISYKGDGIMQRAVITGSEHEMTLETRSAEYEMPALLTLGISYDFLFFGGIYKDMDKDERKDEGLTRDDADHRLTLAGSFTANSYSRDVFTLGLEYGFKQYFMVRVGYGLESFGVERNDPEKPNRITAITGVNPESIYSGLSLGCSVGIPLVKKEKGNQKLVLDYAYRFTNKWKGNHYVSLKLAL